MPKGFSYLANFISEEEEKLLLSSIEQGEWYYRGSDHRAMQSYGFNYKKGETGLNQTTPIPSELEPILSRIKTFAAKEFNQMTVNRYQPGQGIDPHWDHTERFGDTIAGLTLESGCLMTFSKVFSTALPVLETSPPIIQGIICKVKNKSDPDGNHCPEMDKFEQYLEPRSLYLMQDEVRYGWKHGIRRVHSDLVNGREIPRGVRTSLTFRVCNIAQLAN